MRLNKRLVGQQGCVCRPGTQWNWPRVLDIVVLQVSTRNHKSSAYFAAVKTLLGIHALDVAVYVAQEVHIGRLSVFGVLHQHIVERSLARILRSKYPENNYVASVATALAQAEISSQDKARLHESGLIFGRAKRNNNNARQAACLLLLLQHQGGCAPWSCNPVAVRMPADCIHDRTAAHIEVLL